MLCDSISVDWLFVLGLVWLGCFLNLDICGFVLLFSGLIVGLAEWLFWFSVWFGGVLLWVVIWA